MAAASRKTSIGRKLEEARSRGRSINSGAEMIEATEVSFKRAMPKFDIRKAPLPSSRKRGLGLRTNLDRLRGGRSGLRLFTLRLTAALALPVAALAVTVTHLSLGHERILVALSLVPPNAQLVVDVPDAGDRVEDVLGQALRLPALDSPCEGHFTVLNPDLNPRGIQHAVMGQMLANILLDSGVAALIALWAAPTVWPGHPASGCRIACSATAALTPVAARTLLPVALFAAV